MEARNANPNGVRSRAQRVDIVPMETFETHWIGKRLGEAGTVVRSKILNLNRG